MKFYIAVTLAVFLSGCVTTAEKPKKNNLIKEIVAEATLDKLHANGNDLFCVQPEYLACFDITQQQCINDMQENEEFCVSKVEKKLPNKTFDEVDDYSQFYAMCLVTSHVTTHLDKLDQIGPCLKRLELDQDLFRDTLSK